jgi:glycosyltransferase involved in cell wall biosynthesis
VARTFSIITTCKGRLEHLKRSLPKMVAQRCQEVIVVDYSCPESSGEFVARHFPSARVVRVAGEEHFSNWRARNAGAPVATSDVLVFVDADTILSDAAIEWLSRHFPEAAYGFFDRDISRSFNSGGTRLATNQLKGFHVVPASVFRMVGGYDEVLEGYAAGGDTYLEERLSLAGLARHSLDPRMVAEVIQHDAASRSEHHADPVKTSYCAGLLYRTAKLAVLRLKATAELPLSMRQGLYEIAMNAARGLGSKADKVSITVNVETQPILMPRQLGYARGSETLSLRVELSLEDKLSGMPE